MPTRKIASAVFLPIVAGLLLLFALTTLAAWRNTCPTFDEPLHFMGAWLQAHYDDFRCDPEDPPLWRSYVMLGTSRSQLKVPTSGLVWDSMLYERGSEGLYFKDVFYHTPGNDVDGLMFAARVKMAMLGVALGALIAWWAWRWAGPRAALVACAAFCFDPNFLAYSPLVKNDVPIALALLLFMAAVWIVGQRVTLLRWLFVALTLGAALSVKFSGIIAIPLLGICLLIRAMLPDPWPFPKSAAPTRGRRMFLAVGLTFSAYLFAYGFIWACYHFRYGPSTDPNQLFDFRELPRIISRHEAFAAYNEFTLTPDQLRQWYAHWKPDLLLRLGLWADQVHLLPQTWIEGFLFTYGTAPGRASFLLGKFSMSGRWYYFPIAMAVKTPLATLAALILAAGYWAHRRFPSRRWWDLSALALMPATYLALAMRSELNLGLRHVLPVYPFLFIFLGITAADALQHMRTPARILVALFLLGLASETCLAYPDFIPFFNVAAGGWRNGPYLLGGSNVDWGQELPALAQWHREHPRFQLFLNYVGSADPRYYRIDYVNLPGSFAPEDQAPDNSAPRVFAVSAAAFFNPGYSSKEQNIYGNLLRRKPLAVLGHCMYLYNPP